MFINHDLKKYSFPRAGSSYLRIIKYTVTVNYFVKQYIRLLSGKHNMSPAIVSTTKEALPVTRCVITWI